MAGYREHAAVGLGEPALQFEGEQQVGQQLRRLFAEGVREVTLLNPKARHSIAVGLLLRCRIRIEGSLGCFACGLIDGPEVHITGRVGWSTAENMMSGVVVIDKNAGSLTGAALRGGDLVVRGHVGARTGIDQKGGTIIVRGNAGSMTGFMLQRGRQIICGDVGPGLGDSMYDGAIYVGGKIASLGVDCVEAELTAADEDLIDRKFRIYQLDRPVSFRKFVCGASCGTTTAWSRANGSWSSSTDAHTRSSPYEPSRRRRLPSPRATLAAKKAGILPYMALAGGLLVMLAGYLIFWVWT